jgi:Fuc2NAc and GlcNAc transferase
MLGVLFLAGGDPEAGLLAAILAFACLGFVPWNLGNARVFMGDVASAPLGFAFAGLLLYGVVMGRFSWPVGWLVMLVFFCDSSLTLLARLLRGERWYTPHKQHLYQQLIVSGWSHGSVLSLYQAVNLVVLVPAIAVAVNYPASAPLLAAVTTLVIGTGWLLAKRKLWSARS